MIPFVSKLIVIARQRSRQGRSNLRDCFVAILLAMTGLIGLPSPLYAKLENFQAADVVVGQPDFNSGTANNGGRSASSLSVPAGVFSDGKRLFVADGGNHRILIWNSIPTSNFAPADVVLGQPDFSQATANNGGTSASSLSGPTGVSSDGKRLFALDPGNNRILIFNIGGSSIKLGPQFEQGKAVLGKVFWDLNGNGVQDTEERGIEGVKVVSDTGIYAITDEDGKYHFPYIETGQRVLKIDESTLPEGAKITTESPRKIVVTPGILTKVSFGVQIPEDVIAGEAKQSPDSGIASATQGLLPRNDGPLLKVSVSQDAFLLNPKLEVSAKYDQNKIIFTIDCNYFLFIEKAELKLYDKNYKLLNTVPLPSPLPYQYELPKTELKTQDLLYYQLSVYDKDGKEDRTGIGTLELSG